MGMHFYLNFLVGHDVRKHGRGLVHPSHVGGVDHEDEPVNLVEVFWPEKQNKIKPI